MSAFLSSVFGAGAQLFDNQGRVLSGGKLYTLVAGSVGLTNLQASYTDSTQATQNDNPLLTDSTGRLTSNGSTPTEIWLASGSTYKFVLTDSAGNTLGTWDNINGVNDTSTSVTEWIATGLTPTYLSGTQFSVAGNQTSVFTVNRRVQFVCAGGTGYGYVSVSTYSAPTTTITLVNDSLAMDAGLSAVSVALLNATNPSVPQQYLTVIFPSGTRLAFQQTAVPTGWTKDTTAGLDDCAMRIVIGAAGSGGSLGLSSANTGSYTLQVADIPSHTHTYHGVSGINTVSAGGVGVPAALDQNTGAQGGGGGHTHPLAIKYYDFSIGVKN